MAKEEPIGFRVAKSFLRERLLLANKMHGLIYPIVNGPGKWGLALEILETFGFCDSPTFDYKKPSKNRVLETVQIHLTEIVLRDMAICEGGKEERVLIMIGERYFLGGGFITNQNMSIVVYFLSHTSKSVIVF